MWNRREDTRVSEIRPDLKYTAEHEWVYLEGDEATVGITDYAQEQLGDIVFVELPDMNSTVTYTEPFGTIEAVKAANDLFCPVTGEVVDVNGAISDDPALVNGSPYDEGWMIKVKITDAKLLEELLSATQYKEAIGEE